jgi:hypothetical protein
MTRRELRSRSARESRWPKTGRRSSDDDLSPDQSFNADFNEPGEPGEKSGIHGAKLLRWPGNPNSPTTEFPLQRALTLILERPKVCAGNGRSQSGGGWGGDGGFGFGGRTLEG